MELKNNSFAVVGASNNPEKYGYKVVEALKRITKKVFPVNPNETQILGLRVFKELKEIKEKVNIVVFVVPPQVTLKVLQESYMLFGKEKHCWFQPGSFDDRVIEFCRANWISFTDDKCIIVESGKIR